MSFLARLWVALAWCAVVLVAAVLTLLFWPFLRPVFVGERRRGIAPRSHRTEQLLAECALAAESAPITGPESDQRDPGDETDVPAVTWTDAEARQLEIQRTLPRLFCVVCGHGETIASFDAELLPPCPDCQGTRWGHRPGLPIIGEPRELAP